MTLALLDRQRKDTIDYAVRSYAIEDYDSALKHMGMLWAFYRMEEKLDQMNKCDNIILRLLSYINTENNLMNIHWRGSLNVHRIVDDFEDFYKKQDPILEEILKGTN